MATKGPRRQGTKWWGSSNKDEKKKESPLKSAMKKRGTGKSKRMDDIMGGLSRDRRRK